MMKLQFSQCKIGANKSLLGMLFFICNSLYMYPLSPFMSTQNSVLTVRYNGHIIFIYCKKIMIHDDAWCSMLHVIHDFLWKMQNFRKKYDNKTHTVLQKLNANR